MNPPETRPTSPPPADQASGSEEASDPKPLYTIVLDPRCGVGSRFSHQVLRDHVIHTANPLQHSRMSDDYCQLQLGSFAGDSLGVYYTADQDPGTVTRLSINDLLASDAARITGGTPDGPHWRGSLTLDSGAQLPLRPARAEDYPGPIDISAFRCVDIYEHKDCNMVDSHVIQTKWTSPDPDWAALADDLKSSSDLAPFSTEVRSRLRDAGITAADHFSHLRRRDWLNVSPESFPIVKLETHGVTAPLLNRSPAPVADQDGADIPYNALGNRTDSAAGSDHVNMEDDDDELPTLDELRSTDYLSRCHPVAALEPFPADIRARLMAQDEHDFMIEYSRGRTSQRVLQDYTVMIDGKVWHWQSVRPGEVGSEEHLNATSADMVFLQPSDRNVDLQSRAESQQLAKANGEVNYVFDWKSVRELSCVNTLEHFIAYNKTQCEYYGMAAPLSTTPEHLREVPGYLSININEEQLVLHGVWYCQSYTDNVIVVAHLVVATNWWIDRLSGFLVGPTEGAKYHLTEFTDAHAVGLEYAVHDQHYVWVLNVKRGVNMGTTRSNELLVPQPPLSTGVWGGATFPILGENLSVNLRLRAVASDLTTSDILAFLKTHTQPSTRELPYQALAGFLEQPSVRTVDPQSV
ncbi:hypothetical protein T484DRAFT_1864437 [Baffinella frigidus]|nr:hypothetical protein T484DRAFT_1864437 [Cryptophyta sp. CCMP2293]